MLSDNDAKVEFGLSEAELAEMVASADSYDEGVWPEGRVQVMGRPALYGIRMQSVTYRDTADEVALMDQRAASLSMSRSDYLRHLVRADLATA